MNLLKSLEIPLTLFVLGGGGGINPKGFKIARKLQKKHFFKVRFLARIPNNVFPVI